MDLNGLMDLHLHIRIGIKENLIMEQLVLMQAITKVASRWDGDILMNEDCNGMIIGAITGSHYTFVNELQVQ